jgi:hypothetical protein
MKGMQPGAPHGAMSMERMMEVHRRMMDDPVIRARVEADPVLRQMMADMHGGEGMDHGSVQASEAAADTAQALDFVVRLLSDPEVEARIHSDPRLHRLWSDPEVQRRLAELRRDRPAAPRHQH